jgi:hypothetical protein
MSVPVTPRPLFLPMLCLRVPQRRFIKTIAKPITSYMKKEAPKRPRFSKLCVGIGQGVHSMFSRLNVLASGYKFVGVKPLPVDEALVKGVEYLSEFMVISASTTIIMIEVSTFGGELSRHCVWQWR